MTLDEELAQLCASYADAFWRVHKESVRLAAAKLRLEAQWKAATAEDTVVMDTIRDQVGRLCKANKKEFPEGARSRTHSGIEIGFRVHPFSVEVPKKVKLEELLPTLQADPQIPVECVRMVPELARDYILTLRAREDGAPILARLAYHQVEVKQKEKFFFEEPKTDAA